MAHIFLIEDDPLVREAFELILASDGHRVSSAADGASGLRQIEQGRYDLVITDIMMPEKDGVEVINALRKSHRDLPIIAVSGGARGSATDYLHIAKVLGAVEVLSKPIGAKELLAAVKKALPPENGEQR